VDKFVIKGGNPLKGTVSIGGAKNASLALVPATILASGTYQLYNTPDLRDVATMNKLIESMGIQTSYGNNSLTIDSRTINNYEAPYEHVKKMRASIYVLGPLVSRFGKAKVSLPGGCAWGPRPVNLHIDGIRKLGAEIDIEAGYIIAKAKRLHGARILFDISSVGATGNVMMAAALAKGETLIENAAQEPEIAQLAEFLIKMGAKIQGVGTGRLEIEGVDELHPADMTTIPDRIEAGTFLVAAAIAGDSNHIGALLVKLEDAGAKINSGADWIELTPPAEIAAISATTAIYPGFPTDMQAQWIALMSLAKGTSIITDTVYFDRFMHVPELVRLGADITVKENIATVVGVKKLIGAKVMSTDLRASASLILAGLVAENTTEVLRVYHIDRGYESIEKKLQALGADIKREKGEEF
jgi:UDP-N-acetylglucosamine 1-carboxyvinyltransferase